jgi:two-component system LytT family sensor kinase
MKKIILVLITIIILSSPSYAQIAWSAYSQSYQNGTTDKPSNIGIVTCIPEESDAFWGQYPNEALQRSLANDTSFQHNRPKSFIAINAFDTTRAQFFLHGVDKTNAGDFEFRVTGGEDKIIVPWSGVKKFPTEDVLTASGMPKMAYLGGYAAPVGNKIIVDIRKKGSTTISATSVVAWRPIRPLLSDIYTANELNVFLKRLARPWSYRRSPEEVDKWRREYPGEHLDKTGGLPKKLVVGIANNNLVFYLSTEIHKKEQLEYELIRDGKPFKPWKTNDFDNGFIWLKDLKPGEYVLNMRYAAQRQHVTAYPFLIKTPWYQSDWFDFIEGLSSTVFVAFLISLVYNFKQKQKAKKELSKKTRLQLELKAIYTQLNPHFIFNALNSIQGLINKQDIKGANNYLSDFATLMRETLSNSDKQQIALKQEIATLETYLKLEQLRFGFKYDIIIDKNINVYETEIPSLLLQPLIENAIKHGVSGLQEKGIVTVNFSRQGDNMTVSITDNGKGFTIDESPGGFGLKLTRDRIKLLNAMTKEQTILVEVKRNQPSGARVELSFKNWFL